MKVAAIAFQLRTLWHLGLSNISVKKAIPA